MAVFPEVRVFIRKPAYSIRTGGQKHKVPARVSGQNERAQPKHRLGGRGWSLQKPRRVSQASAPNLRVYETRMRSNIQRGWALPTCQLASGYSAKVARACYNMNRSIS